MKAIGNHLDPFETGQVLEKWIARLRYQCCVTGVAEQLEEPAVGFTGARRQNDLRRMDVSSAAGVGGGDSLARNSKTEGLRIVTTDVVGAQHGEQVVGIRDPNRGRVGLSQVKDRDARRLERRQSPAERVDLGMRR